MAAFSFRHLPILGPKDTTANFEQLTGVIDRLEEEITALKNNSGTQSIANEPWKLVSALGFEHSWVVFEAGGRLPGYRIDRLGNVQLRGLIKSGENEKSAFKLPIGYRPKDQQVFIVNTHNVPGGVRVESSGEVIPVDITAGASKEWTFLNQVFFSTQ